MKLERIVLVEKLELKMERLDKCLISKLLFELSNYIKIIQTKFDLTNFIRFLSTLIFSHNEFDLSIHGLRWLFPSKDHSVQLLVDLLVGSLKSEGWPVRVFLRLF